MFVLKSGKDLAAGVKENSGHLQSIAPQSTEAMPSNDGCDKTSNPDCRPQQFGDPPHAQTKQTIESTCRIRDARKVGD